MNGLCGRLSLVLTEDRTIASVENEDVIPNKEDYFLSFLGELDGVGAFCIRRRLNEAVPGGAFYRLRHFLAERKLTPVDDKHDLAIRVNLLVKGCIGRVT